ncbi:peptidoglycan editing factor PgeF [Aliikangiella coralliicola]|uniref:Purine nucleoside phosphorylase n=1 Tax=Aliikangiella coralliicola TaxID=2592383 RepID=A0A545U0P0_9GAMM|nr:peptidoglycan editing factor PgeF [Aliikangiella coralliicola]
MGDSFIHADWAAPKNVNALVTTRAGGFSQGVYASFNLAHHVDDEQAMVEKNRRKLESHIRQNRNIKQYRERRSDNSISLFWLDQIHSNRCVRWETPSCLVSADASYSSGSNQVCVVMTADCLPILLTNSRGNWVAACHAGWRGLANGVIENTIACYSGPASDLMAWIGPAISQPYFEVGAEVYDQFIALNAEHELFFEPNSRHRFQFDFIGLARHKLSEAGIQVFGGKHCSFADDKRFFSYRRDGQTGRMASMIWFE